MVVAVGISCFVAGVFCGVFGMCIIRANDNEDDFIMCDEIK